MFDIIGVWNCVVLTEETEDVFVASCVVVLIRVAGVKISLFVVANVRFVVVDILSAVIAEVVEEPRIGISVGNVDKVVDVVVFACAKLRK